MPIVWLTSFNGTDTYIGGNGMSISASNTNATEDVLSWGSEFNAVFGSGRVAPTATTIKQPTLAPYGRKYAYAENYDGTAYFGFQDSTWDPTSRALVTAMVRPRSGDYIFGLYVNVESVIPKEGNICNSWRFGIRIGRSKNSPASQYTTVIGNGGSRWSSNDENRYTDKSAADLLAKESYFEIEWLKETSTINVYVDDILAVTRDFSASANKSLASRTITFITEHYGPAGMSLSKVLEFRDAYLQTIESENDTRLGSSVSVRRMPPKADDVVDFNRPAGYDSNAAVASLPIKIGQVSDASLSASLPGTQDLYTVDSSLAATGLASVEAVAVRSMATNPGTGNRSFASLIKSGGTQSQSVNPAEISPGAPAVLATHILNADPSDGSRWTLTKLADLKVGTKFIG